MSDDIASYVLMIDHAGQKRTHKFNLNEDHSLVIGRSWQSDIVLNDEFIDPEHLRLSLDSSGVFSIEDMNTTNGTRAGKHALREKTNYRKGTKLSLGDTIVSIIDADTMVAPALKRDTVHKMSRKFQTILWVLFSTIAAILALVTRASIMSSQELNGEAIVSSLTEIGMSAIGVACIGGVLSMLFRRSTLFGLHYVYFCWMVVLFTVVNFAMDIVSFNIDHGLTRRIIDDVAYGAFMLVAAYGFMSFITKSPRKFKLPFMLVLVLVPIAYSYTKPLLESEHDAWSPRARVTSVKQPPMFNFRNPVSVESHLEDTDELFAGLIKEVHGNIDGFDDTTPSKDSAQSTLQVSESE